MTGRRDARMAESAATRPLRWATLAADTALHPVRSWRRWGPWGAIQAAALAAWEGQGRHALALARHGLWGPLAALLAAGALGAWAWVRGLRVLWPRPDPRIPAWQVGVLGLGGIAAGAVLETAVLLAGHVRSLGAWALAALAWWIGSDVWWATVWGCWCALPRFSGRAVLRTLRRQAGAWVAVAAGIAACDGLVAAGWRVLAASPAGGWPAAVLTLWGMTWQVGWATRWIARPLPDLPPPGRVDVPPRKEGPLPS